MKNSILPSETSIAIIKEKQIQIREIMNKVGIDCWLVYARETEVNNEPVLSYIVGNDVVWGAIFLFILHNNSFIRIALVGNFDASTEQNKGIWDQVIGYKEGLTEPLRKIIQSL